MKKRAPPGEANCVVVRHTASDGSKGLHLRAIATMAPGTQLTITFGVGAEISLYGRFTDSRAGSRNRPRPRPTPWTSTTTTARRRCWSIAAEPTDGAAPAAPKKPLALKPLLTPKSKKKATNAMPKFKAKADAAEHDEFTVSTPRPKEALEDDEHPWWYMTAR